MEVPQMSGHLTYLQGFDKALQYITYSLSAAQLFFLIMHQNYGITYQRDANSPFDYYLQHVLMLLCLPIFISMLYTFFFS